MRAQVVSIADVTLDTIPYPLGWFTFFIEDWLGGTKHMEPDERGIYLDFIVAFYAHGAPLRDDDRDMARECRCSMRVWRRVKQRLIELEKIAICDGLIRHSKCEAVLRKAKTSAKLRRNSGRKGGRKRAENYAKALIENSAGQANAKASALAGLKQAKDHYLDTTYLDAAASVSADAKEGTEGRSSPLPASSSGPPPTSIMLTPEAVLWSNAAGGGLGCLTACGIGEPKARIMLGGWRKQYPDADVLKAITWFVQSGRSDPASAVAWWLKANGTPKGASSSRPEFNPNLI